MPAQKWFKFYGQEYLSDPKIERLTPTERSCWLSLLCIGSLTDGRIRFLTVETLLHKSGIQFDPYNPEDWERALGVLLKFQNLEMIQCHENGDILIINWEKRQEMSLTGAERVRRYREKKKNTANNIVIDDCVTGHVTNVTPEEKRIEENTLGETEVSQEFEIVKDETDSPVKPTKFDPQPVYSLFHQVLGVETLPWKKDKTQRLAAENLTKRYKLVKIKSALEYAKENEDREYIPQILSPWDLDQKWDKLAKFKQKYG